MNLTQLKPIVNDNNFSEFNLLSSKIIFTSGMACYAIVAAEHIGIFNTLQYEGFDENKFFQKNPAICLSTLRGILRVLNYAQIIEKLFDKKYSLTPVNARVSNFSRC